MKATADLARFPSFDLTRLLKTVFAPKGGERVAVMIDLHDPKTVKDLAFLDDDRYAIQRHAVHDILGSLTSHTLDDLTMTGGDLYAYEITGGSNLDLPDEAWTPAGERISLERDVYPSYDLILVVSTYSATAPLTAHAKKFGFRGATMHGMNDIILGSGLAVDYEEISRQAEKLRAGMTRADAVEIDFVVDGRKHTLRLELGGQEAQKSHGLCHGGPDVANLPAGEVYYVPDSASGRFPLKLESGTLALMTVEDGRITAGACLKGDAGEVARLIEKFRSDPASGAIGELGFGTQDLPVSGSDIQDEKILGTVHVATGRSDHLGGDLTPDKFRDKGNATHEDILFSPEKTPEVAIPEVRMEKDGETKILIANFQPQYMRALLAS
ncbi:MAG: hypothetical protein R3F54_32585 [Alphaproteobacteria bacterium]